MSDLEFLCGAPAEEVDRFMAAIGYRRADVTELKELAVAKVAAVRAPANGTPFLLTKSESPEADDILTLVTGEEQPESESDGQPRHPASGQFITQDDAAALAAAEKRLRKASTQAERERAAFEVARGRLKVLYSGSVPVTRQEAKKMSATTERVNYPAAMRKLEALHKQATGELKERLGAELAHAKLLEVAAVRTFTKTVAEQERAAANTAIRDAQAKASTPASLARRSDPQGALRAVRDGTSQVQDLGLTGRSGAVEQYDPRQEPDPLVVAGQLEDELAKASDPLVRARLGEDLTLARLKTLHGARGGLAPAA